MTDDMVKYKKYFYVLLPILACKWIEEKLSYYKMLVDSIADDRNPDWESLEIEFRKLVTEKH